MRFSFHESILTAGGIGRLPFAPGTWGSAAAAIVLGLLSHSTVSDWAPWIVLALILVLWPISLRALQASASATKNIDRSCVVIDEVIGMCVTMLPALFLNRASWGIVALGFVLFRMFDVTKPFGIRIIDRQNTPASVLLDDVVAGIFAAAVLGAVVVIW